MRGFGSGGGSGTELEQKKGEAGRVTAVEQSVKAVQESPSILNPSIGMAIDTTFESRGDTDGEFRLRSAELGLSAEIDPTLLRSQLGLLPPA